MYPVTEQKVSSQGRVGQDIDHTFLPLNPVVFGYPLALGSWPWKHKAHQVFWLPIRVWFGILFYHTLIARMESFLISSKGLIICYLHISNKVRIKDLTQDIISYSLRWLQKWSSTGLYYEHRFKNKNKKWCYIEK